MLDFLSWVAIAGFGVLMFVILRILNRGFQVVYVRFTEPEIDYNAVAVENFVCMLKEARESMIVYDDGDNTEGSLYNDPQVINAVHNKLQAKPEFVLQCLFNRDNDHLFKKELAGTPSVTIRTRSSSVPAHEIHYKIIDDGQKAYLSRHRLGSSERRFKIVDCTEVSPRHRERVADVVLGRYKNHFERAFAASKPAN